VENGVADDDRLFRYDRALARRVDDDVSARKALADIVVAFAFKLERDAAREEGAEALAGGALELHMHGVIGKAGVAIDLGDLAREHRARGAVHAANRGLDPDRRAAVDGRARFRDQLAVEDLVDLVVLRLALEDVDA